MNGTINDFVISNNTNSSALAIEALQQQTKGPFNNFEKITVGENNKCQHQVIEKNNNDKIRKAVDIAVMTFENQVHDSILTTMDNVVILRVEMALRSITGSLGQGPCIMVQNTDRTEFTWNTENTPLMSAFS